MLLWEAEVPEERLGLWRIWETADIVPIVLRFWEGGILATSYELMDSLFLSWCQFGSPRVGLALLEDERKAKFSWNVGLGYLIQIMGGK